MQLCCLLFPPQFLQVIVPLLFQIGFLLNLGLVETVDDGVLALDDEHALDLWHRRSVFSPHSRRQGKTDLSLVLEADLADLHASILFEIGPGRVDDGDVILFVA